MNKFATWPLRVVCTIYLNTVKPVYNGPVYSGHPVNQLPYIFCKFDLYISVSLYITVTLPFLKGEGKVFFHTYDILRGSPIGFFNPVIPTRNFMQSRNPEGYFGIPPPAHIFNPESRPNFALKSRIPSFKQGKFRIPKNPLKTPSSG